MLPVTVGKRAAAHVTCQHSHAVLRVGFLDDDGGLPVLRYWLVRERALLGRGRISSFEHPFELEVRASDFGSDGELIVGNLIPRATYRMRIAAENAVGRGLWSKPVMVVAGADTGSSLHPDTPLATAEILAADRAGEDKSVRIYGAHVHLDQPCLGPIAVVCPHNQRVTVEIGVNDGCKGLVVEEIEGKHGIHGHQRHHFSRPHGGDELELEAWILHHSPRTHDVRGELVMLSSEHRYGCHELPVFERRRVSGRYVLLSLP